MSTHTGHHEGGHEAPDPASQIVGVTASVLAVGLALVTIASHRSHTHGITARAEANDQWAYYQSKRIKYHTIELGLDLTGALDAHGAAAEKLTQRYGKEKDRYAKEAAGIKEKAEAKEKNAEFEEQKAMRFDISEGIFEVALIVTSLFFISRRRLFPVIGFIAGLAGVGLAIWGLLLH